MAWFEKSAGDKKVPELERGKTPEALKLALAEMVSTMAEVKPAVRVDEPPVSTIGLVGYLYKGSRVSGQLVFQGSARIDGSVEGDVQCQGTLTIGESAEVKAKISGKAVVIRGKVEGNVSAKEKIELIAPARLIGNIDSPKLIITEGVVFDGDCSMGVAKQMGGVAGSHNVVADVAAVAQGAKATS
jgi:cytoskeletal protein CcmA (bactofilin family)